MMPNTETRPIWSAVDLPLDADALSEIPGAVYSRIVGMDPQAIWLLGAGGSDYLPSPTRVISIIVKLHDDAARGLFLHFAGLSESSDGSADFGILSDVVHVSPNQREHLEKNACFVAFVVLDFFKRLATDARVDGLRMAKKDILLSAVFRSSYTLEGMREHAEIDPANVAPPEGGWPEGTVVMGVIDDGLAIANERFLDGAGETRTYAIWQMNPPRAGAAVSPTVEWGFELLKRGEGGIDELLAASKVGDVLDEDLFYRKAGLVVSDGETRHQSIARRASHGTHVLDVLAGEAPDQNRQDRPIVAVQLDLPTVQDTSGAMLYDRIKAGIDYVVKRADAMSEPGKPLPIVINCSFGYFADRHDSRSPLERYIDQVVSESNGRIRMVLPAGNGHLSRCHAVVAPDPGEVTELPWRVQPDDKTPSYVEIWLPEEDLPADGSLTPQNRVAVSVVAPNGEASAPLDEEAALNSLAQSGDPDLTPRLLTYEPVGSSPVESSKALVVYAWHLDEERGKRRGCFYVILQPTARLQPDARPVAPAGPWTIRLHNKSLPADEEVHAWVQRDDTPFGYPIRGRQSYFDHRDYQRFFETTVPIGGVIEEDSLVERGANCPVKRAGMINAVGTGRESIVVGGYVRRHEGLPGVRQRRDLAPYSAGGPTTGPRVDQPSPPCLDNAPDGPDAAAVSDDSRVLWGILAAGTRSNSTIALNGTSVAAPDVARCVADGLAAGKLPGRAEMQAMACADPIDPPKPARGGAGRIECRSSKPRA